MALFGGADRSRTDDLINAIDALYQLSYGPKKLFAVATMLIGLPQPEIGYVLCGVSGGVTVVSASHVSRVSFQIVTDAPGSAVNSCPEPSV